MPPQSQLDSTGAPVLWLVETIGGVAATQAEADREDDEQPADLQRSALLLF
jgi:hypothetical protein